MIDSYDVTLRGRKVGSVQLTRQGLYYRIACSCDAVDGNIYRLLGSCAGTPVRIGVPVREGDRLILETKLPAKKLAGDALEFWLESVTSRENRVSHPNRGIRYIPIYPDEPFRYLSRLKSAYLEYREGKPGIVITD